MSFFLEKSMVNVSHASFGVLAFLMGSNNSSSIVVFKANIDFPTLIFHLRKIPLVSSSDRVTPTYLEDLNNYDNLENLHVSDCVNGSDFPTQETEQKESSHSVEVFNKVRSLRLHKLPSLKRVWETGGSQPMFTGSSFESLKSPQVDCCNQLEYLFSSSIAKLLVSIEHIEVMNCEQIEEIIAAEEESDEIIALPKVKSIKLESLPNLKYFCGEAYTWKLPSLELLKVINVQNLRLFAPKLIGTHNPRLQVNTALGQAEWIGDLNATLRNIYDSRGPRVCKFSKENVRKE
ncbi:disease resistance protein [Pyrus ussuriensis x Pyrus communis]|uniref:Disease resistance protein n=1 Tax=Pyrus ussuriensis x Pyrus communis TaxID=2448454 RepID=A0A5N5G3Q5_9ROSA|nr:disease resistance protein [Pyrus ussuriensis x Pyrus communis]